MGSASILFQNLSPEDMQAIQDALDAHPSKLQTRMGRFNNEYHHLVF